MYASMDGWMWCKHVYKACIYMYMLVSHASIHACVCIYVWTYQSPLYFQLTFHKCPKHMWTWFIIQLQNANMLASIYARVFQNLIFPNDIMQNNYLSLFIGHVSFLNFRIVCCGRVMKLISSVYYLPIYYYLIHITHTYIYLQDYGAILKLVLWFLSILHAFSE